MRILFFAFLGLSIHLMAQPKINLDEIRLRFPDASAVSITDEVLNLDVINNKLTATREHVMQHIILDEKALGYAERSVTYIPGFFELASFEAFTYVPNGKSYKKLKVEKWEDKNRISDMFFFDDVKYRHFVFPGVQKGAILELRYTYNHLDPNIQFPFHFQESTPILKGNFTINYTDKVRPSTQFFGDTIPIRHTKTTKGKTTSLKWEVSDMKEWKSFANAPSHSYHLPHIFPIVKEFKTDNNGWLAGLNTAKQLYKHNFAFIKDLNVDTPDPKIVSLVDSLKKKAVSDEDLVRTIYYWVQNNMKYIAFEDGLGGFVPRQANDIFRKRYGDCKDMASILTFMYKQAHLPAYVCWIGTRDLPYSYSQLPAPNSDNHMIAAVYMNKRWVFLDATARFLPYGYPSGFIQGKEAMVSISPDSFQVVKVPIMMALANTSFDSTNITLSETKLSGNISVKLEGYHKYDLSERLMLARSDDKEERIEQLLSRGSNKCKIFNINYKNLEERDKPLYITAEMELQDYARKIDGNWYINLNLDKSFQSFKIDTTDRKIGREFEFCFVENTVYSLEIPNGYRASQLPKDIEYKGEKFSYSIHYTLEKTKIVYRFVFKINTLLLEKKDFAEWNKQIDRIIQAYKEVVVLNLVNSE